jgi:ubiquinone/menaquinone biosynthesis C-methylase UbiE
MSHLNYYIKHDIAPVSYDLSDLGAHFQRREALYRTLGVLPLVFRSKQILEVAAGTGHNSLYVASLLPDSYTLLEPNPAGIRAIKDCYAGAVFPHTAPTLIEAKLEDYAPDKFFDIVLCENWLGSSAHERGLLRKLAGFVAPRGVLVVTCVSPIGFMPNVIRRALAAKLTADESDFVRKTEVLVEAFGPHLKTIAGMTRSARDWVQDNMINPAYFDLCLTLPMLVDELGGDFQIAGVSPDFRRDWRWFKALSGKDFEFNSQVLQEYFRVGAALLDYRLEPADSDPQFNRTLEDKALDLVEAVRRYEAAPHAQGPEHGVLLDRLTDIESTLRRGLPSASWAAAVAEARGLLGKPVVAAADVAAMGVFGGWFGRETLYVSLERTTLSVEPERAT